MLVYNQNHVHEANSVFYSALITMCIAVIPKFAAVSDSPPDAYELSNCILLIVNLLAPPIVAPSVAPLGVVNDNTIFSFLLKYQ